MYVVENLRDRYLFMNIKLYNKIAKGIIKGYHGFFIMKSAYSQILHTMQDYIVHSNSSIIIKIMNFILVFHIYIQDMF